MNAADCFLCSFCGTYEWDSAKKRLMVFCNKIGESVPQRDFCSIREPDEAMWRFFPEAFFGKKETFDAQ